MQKIFDKSKLVKNLAHDNILVPFLDREIERFDEPWEFKYEPKKRDEGWHPSGDCLPSVTELWTKATSEVHDSISTSLRKSFMVGHCWHQWVQHIVLHKLEFCEASAIERKGEKVWGYIPNPAYAAGDPITETMLQYSGINPKIPAPYHYVTGSGDFAPLETPRWKGIVDIKTMSGSDFAKGVVPARFADKYRCQLNVYMELFDEDEALILGVNKDSPHDFREFRYSRDQSLIDAILRKWEFVSELLDADQAPTGQDNDTFVLPL